MNKKVLFLTLTIISILSFNTSAKNKTKNLNLNTINSILVENSLYNQIEFIDSRPHHECMLTTIEPDDFLDQLQVLVDSITDDTSLDNCLLLQIRHLYVKEEKKGQIDLYAYMNLYQKEDNHYLLLNTINRRVKIANLAMMDNIISATISRFLEENLKEKSSSNTIYLSEDIYNISNIEKSEIKAYQTSTYTSGIYANYEEFAAQTPSQTKITVEMKNEQIKNVKTAKEGSSKLEKVDPQSVYIVVYENIPYFVVKKKYIPVRKEDNEFTLEINKEKRVNYGASFGMIGVLLTPDNVTEEKSTYIIDHLDGELALKEKKIKEYTKSIFSNKRFKEKNKVEY